MFLQHPLFLFNHGGILHLLVLAMAQLTLEEPVFSTNDAPGILGLGDLNVMLR